MITQSVLSNVLNIKKSTRLIFLMTLSIIFSTINCYTIESKKMTSAKEDFQAGPPVQR